VGIPSPADFAAIVAARGRDEIFDASLKALARRFRTSAVLAVRTDGVVGLAGQGDRVRPEALRSLDIPWSEPSIFLNVRMSRVFYLGPLPPLPRHKALAAALGGWPVECLVQPVLMREKTVAFFYVESASTQGVTPADLTYVRELAGATAAALAASIRLKKKQVI
jgi:GAF domain-containing protein